MAGLPIIAILRRLGGGVDNDQLAAYARPHDPADYEVPELDGSGPAAADIPLGETAPDASWDVWPARTLDRCREPLVAGAADLRGVWEVYKGRMRGHVERVEQAGNRVTITTGGLVHDMFCDGTLENGVDDRCRLARVRRARDVGDDSAGRERFDRTAQQLALQRRNQPTKYANLDDRGWKLS